MESEFNEPFVPEEPIDREVSKLIREVEEQDRIRRAVIEMLVILGSDAMLEYDV